MDVVSLLCRRGTQEKILWAGPIDSHFPQPFPKQLRPPGYSPTLCLVVLRHAHPPNFTTGSAVIPTTLSDRVCKIKPWARVAFTYTSVNPLEKELTVDTAANMGTPPGNVISIVLVFIVVDKSE